MKNIFPQYFRLPPVANSSWLIADWKASCQ